MNAFNVMQMSAVFGIGMSLMAMSEAGTPIASDAAKAGVIPQVTEPALSSANKHGTGIDSPLRYPTVSDSYGKLPLSFERNQGQTDAEVKFLARGHGHTLFLTSHEAVLVWAPSRDAAATRSQEDLPAAPTAGALRIKLTGADSAAEIIGIEPHVGTSNYFIGDDAATWHTHVPRYGKVKYHGVYPGVDLIYYGNQQQLEYDFIVAPGTDPAVITLGLEGTENIRIDADGDLVMTTANGDVRQHKPIIYQEIDGRRQEIAGNYVLKNAAQVGFEIARYDVTKPLIIDPILSYSTLLGGSAFDGAASIAVDASGHAYITGSISSANFPTTGGAGQPGSGGSTDAFVAKLSPDGSTLIYATYLGGNVVDQGTDIAVDAAGNAYVTGTTHTPFSGANSFPTTANAFQTIPRGSKDVFVSKLNATGSALVYSTFVASNADDEAHGIAVDNTGAAHVTGETLSTTNFPVTPGALQTTSNGNVESFVSKLNANGTALIYSTYLGGNGSDVAFDIVVDSAGNAYVGGPTSSNNFPTTPGSFQPLPGVFGGSFIAKLNASGSALIYGTYLSAQGSTVITGIAIDAPGSAYVTGDTTAFNFPTTPGALQTASLGLPDAFVTKLTPDGSALVYSSFLGGSGADQGRSIAVDSSGSAHLLGSTLSNNFPVADPIQASYAGGGDIFVSKVNPTGTALVYSTYLGGSAEEITGAIAVDIADNAYITGTTLSANFPTTPGAFQTTFNGHSMGYVAKIIPGNQIPVADAGPDQSVDEFTPVTLDGSASHDPDGNPLSYQWMQVAGTAVVLNLSDPIHPTFTAPDVPAGGETLSFVLVVNDGTQNSDPDAVDITVKNVNHPPVADAGDDQVVQEGSPVSLDGSNSFDTDNEPLTYSWIQTAGTTVVLSDVAAAEPSFTAPSVGTAGETLTFELTVSDGIDSATDAVSVAVENVNHAPTANAGPDRTVDEGSPVTLDGTASADPDADSLGYTWSQTVGTPVTLSDNQHPTPGFTAPLVAAGGESLVFQLVVNDGELASNPDTVSITVQNVNDPPACGLARPEPSLLWPPNHSLVPIMITGVSDPDNSDITIVITSVTQDEPVNGLGDGDTSPDAVTQNDGVLVRAERSATGNGRVYEILFSAVDGQGGSCNGSVFVGVPHSKKATPADDGQGYDATLP